MKLIFILTGRLRSSLHTLMNSLHYLQEMKLFQAFQLTDKVKLFSTVNILLMTMQIVPLFVTVESKSLSSGKFLPATCKPCNALAAARKSIATAEVHTILNTVWCFHNKVQLLI